MYYNALRYNIEEARCGYWNFNWLLFAYTHILQHVHLLFFLTRSRLLPVYTPAPKHQQSPVYFVLLLFSVFDYSFSRTHIIVNIMQFYTYIYMYKTYSGLFTRKCILFVYILRRPMRIHTNSDNRYYRIGVLEILLLAIIEILQITRISDWTTYLISRTQCIRTRAVRSDGQTLRTDVMVNGTPKTEGQSKSSICSKFDVRRNARARCYCVSVSNIILRSCKNHRRPYTRP